MYHPEDQMRLALYVGAWLYSILYCMTMLGECSDNSSVVMIESSSVGEIYAACNVVKYSNGTQFDTSVKWVLKYLADKAPINGFSCVTGSSGEQTVHAKCGQSLPYLQSGLQGRLQCRGDISSADCRACSLQAIDSIQRDCPNAIGARVQLEYCFLRYENYSFLCVDDRNYWFGLENVNSEKDPAFNKAARGLMADLRSKAPLSYIRFALGSISVVSSNVTIYGMQMCWRDVSANDCQSCLSKGIDQMFSCCSGRVGVQIFMGTCTLRYEIYPIAKKY